MSNPRADAGYVSDLYAFACAPASSNAPQRAGLLRSPARWDGKDWQSAEGKRLLNKSFHNNCDLSEQMNAHLQRKTQLADMVGAVQPSKPALGFPGCSRSQE